MSLSNILSIISVVSYYLERGECMPDFQKEFPNAARYLKQRYPDKEPLSSFWHWAILALFALLCIATIKQQLLLIGGLILVSALIKGPGILVFGDPLFLVSQFISANRCRSFRTFFAY